MMWTVERPNGGRGFGFSGGHFHDNFRRVVLHGILWIAKVEAPPNGVNRLFQKNCSTPTWIPRTDGKHGDWNLMTFRRRVNKR